jgi:hypothetical protein
MSNTYNNDTITINVNYANEYLFIFNVIQNYFLFMLKTYCNEADIWMKYKILNEKKVSYLLPTKCCSGVYNLHLVQ